MLELGEHALIVGMSGSGKSVAAATLVCHLSKAYPQAGVLIINHKKDETIDSILPPTRKLPGKLKRGGKYNLHPLIQKDDAEIERLLEQVHKQGNWIVYIDEGYMISPRSYMLMALYTQGRSKKISVITLSQRPTWISRFAVTEASVIQVFNLNGKDDVKTLENNIRSRDKNYLLDTVDKLERYSSFVWYSKKREGIILAPYPHPVRCKIVEEKRGLKWWHGLFILPIGLAALIT